MKISLRLRLTLLTSAILVLVSIAFTLFTIFNANKSITAAILTEPAGSVEVEMTDLQFQESLRPAEAVDTTVFSRNSLWFLGGVIVLGSVIMYFVSGIILRPLNKFSKTVASVDKDGLETRIEGFNAGDELTKLAKNFNSMLERLNRAFQRERRFSQSAAHELKTPLAIIKTNIDVMNDSPDSEECMEVICVVKEQVNRMTALVEQIQTLSAGDAVDWQQLDFAKLVSELALESGGIRLDLCPCVINGNRVLLRNAVENLINNGKRYGKMPMEVVLKCDGIRAVLEVRDSGDGISEEDRERIFEPFYRVDKSRSRALGGSGLGLAIAKEIAQIHGGDLICAENKPVGTVFRLTLPRNQAGE